MLAMVAAASAGAQPAATRMTAATAAQAFGAREQIGQISLSPDGRKVAMIVPAATGRGAALMIADLTIGGEPRLVMRSSGDPDRLNDCQWATSTRLICRIYMILKDVVAMDFTRLVAVNADGSDLKLLTARERVNALRRNQNGGRLIDWGNDDATGSALMTRDFVPESSAGSNITNNRNGLGIELVDSVSLGRKTVEPPRGDAVEYISDGYGTVRVMGVMPQTQTRYAGDTIMYLYRRPGSRAWERLGDLKIGSGISVGFNPVAVDRDANAVYGYDRADGRAALFRIALDGTLKRELMVSRPDVDVDGLITVGRHQRVIGASYVTDKRQSTYFDPDLAKLRTMLARAVPGKPLVSFVDASSDGDALLLFMGADTDPGRYYVYRKKARKLEEVLPVRPQLAGTPLATVRAISYPAGDGTSIPGYLTLPPGSDGKNLPAIVLPHGGPGARDEWGFDWLSQFFAVRGFAVIQPNFRGSTGYGDAWFQKNGFQSWRTAIGDVDDAGRWLVKQGIADPAKLAIFGWSYGGYAALQSSMLDADLFKAVIAVAPVTDLDALREESRDYSNFLLVDRFIGHGAHLKDGSPARNAAAIKAPVLMFHGTLDRNVGVGESRLMADRLRAVGGKVDYVEFKGLDHYLEDSAARTQMLEKSDAFLRAALKM